MFMPTSLALRWWISAPRRLWTCWVEGYAPAPESWPIPPDADRLGTPAGIPLFRPIESGVALDHYRRGTLWRTAVGAEIFRFKYRGDLDAGWRLVYAAAEFLRAQQIIERVNKIVAVPSGPVFRKFSPSGWLAQRLSERIDKPILADIFVRTRLGAKQKEIASFRAKRANIAGMFTVSETGKPRLAGRRILLLDDVCDSGCTLAELRDVLIEAGSTEVLPFAFAHTGKQTRHDGDRHG